MDQFPTVVGIDVGGPKKGFHAVAIRGTDVAGRDCFSKPTDVLTWCRDHNAQVVAVDAPCCWSSTGRARQAERELMAQRIFAFSTPSREKAETHKFYGWMLQGARLYLSLKEEFPLFDGKSLSMKTAVETFPQAVACALAGKVISAKNKKVVRPELIRAAGLDASLFPSIDYIDAALCALAAQSLIRGSYTSYGSAADGFIVVPLPTPVGLLRS